MGKQTFRITFFVRKTRVGKNGLAPILARITINGVAKEMNINCFVYPERWDQSKERSKGKDRLSNEVNNFLDEFRANTIEIMNDLQKTGTITTYEVVERLKGKGSSVKMFLAEFESYCKKRQNEATGKFISQLTANKYHRLCRYMKEYIAEEYKNDDILLSAVNHAYIDGLNTFVQTRYNCHHNGAVNLLNCLRNFLLFCIKNEWIVKNPFQYFKLKEEHCKVKDHLSNTEIISLINKQMPNKRLEQVRDVFVFCCFTGMAFTDADHLRSEHLGRDEHGNRWVRKPREKTGILSQIPLLPYPLAILTKYMNDQDLKNNDKLLPVPSNQKMNAYLKEIATICNIDKNLTTHCARHTFACVAASFGMPIDVIAKILGHTNVNMTRHYAKYSEDVICKEMFNLGRKLQEDSRKLQDNDLKRAQ